MPEPPKPKRGPKPKLSEGDLLRRRDSLIYWLEDNWPELSRGIRKAKSGEQLIPTLRRMPTLDAALAEAVGILLPKADATTTIPGTLHMGSLACRNSVGSGRSTFAAVIRRIWKFKDERFWVTCRGMFQRLKAIRAADGDSEQIREILQRRTKEIQLIILSQQSFNVAQYLKDGEPTFAASREIAEHQKLSHRSRYTSR